MLASQGPGGGGRGRSSLLWPDTWKPASGNNNNKSSFNKMRVSYVATPGQAQGSQPVAPGLLGSTVSVGKRDAHRAKALPGVGRRRGGIAPTPKGAAGPW